MQAGLTEEPAPAISLLHATHHRRGGPDEVRQAWLGRAQSTATIEYIVALDEDDLTSETTTRGWTRVVGSSSSGIVTAVRNWNAAAAVASGDVLFVIADDLFPPEGWDATLLAMIHGLDPVSTPFAIKIRDTQSVRATKMLHPVVSRGYYERFGLFHPEYRGVFCDNDLTLTAYWRSFILDGRNLVLEHRHPSTNATRGRSRSQSRINAPDEYEDGRRIYQRRWSRRERRAPRLLLPTSSGRPLDRRHLHLRQWCHRSLSTLLYPVLDLRQRMQSR